LGLFVVRERVRQGPVCLLRHRSTTTANKTFPVFSSLPSSAETHHIKTLPPTNNQPRWHQPREPPPGKLHSPTPETSSRGPPPQLARSCTTKDSTVMKRKERFCSFRCAWTSMVSWSLGPLTSKTVLPESMQMVRHGN
jgi:hypothetical protein